MLGDLLAIELGCCLLVLIIIVAALILSFIFRVLIKFLPATILGIAMYLLTGNLILSLVVFGVVALIMVIASSMKD